MNRSDRLTARVRRWLRALWGAPGVGLLLGAALAAAASLTPAGGLRDYRWVAVGWALGWALAVTPRL